MTLDLLLDLSALCDDGGAPLTEADFAALIPAIVFGCAAEGISLELPPAAARILDRMIREARIFESDGPKECASKISAWYAAHPVRADLLRVVERRARSDAAASSRAMLAAVGAELVLRAIGAGERPEGSTPAGPMAQFLLVAPKKRGGRQ